MKTKGYKYRIILFFIVLLGNLKAQTPLPCRCTKQIQTIAKEFLQSNEKIDSTTIRLKLDSTLQEHGYLLAKIHFVQDTLLIEEGEQFLFAVRNKQALDTVGISALLNRNSFRPYELRALTNKIVVHFARNGHPYAEVQVTNTEISGNTILATLSFNLGERVVYEPLKVNSEAPVKKEYLMQLLDIHPGMLFNQQNVNQIQEKLKREGNFKLTGPIQVSMFAQTAEIELELERTKNNAFDGFIGFFPNSGAENKMVVSGDLHLALHNVFKSGKTIQFDWQSFKPASQKLNLLYRHPFLFRSPLHFSTSLDLLKEDSTFFNRTLHFDLGVQLKNGLTLSAFSKFNSSTVLESESLPTDVLANNSMDRYGLSLHWVTKKESKEFQTAISYDLGKKKIASQSGISDPLYQQIKEGYTMGQFNFESNALLTLRSPIKWYGKLQLGGLIADYIFINDLFRLGGRQTIRGFNENAFFVSKFALFQQDIRYYIGEDAYLLLFFDIASTELKSLNEDNGDLPFGFGAGLQTGTENGKFYITFAMGKSNFQNLSINESKIHFGYKAYF